jgi:hypothetical protein
MTIEIFLMLLTWIFVGCLAGLIKHSDQGTSPFSLYGLLIIIAGPLGFLLPKET